MPPNVVPDPLKGGGATPLFAYSGGFFRNRRVRRILALAGYCISFGIPPKTTGKVAVWGRTGRARRGYWMARWRDAGVVSIEDGFLRSVLTGRDGAAPLGLVIDRKGVYFDCSAASDLEDILNFAALSAADLPARATAGMARLKSAHLSKYNAFDPGDTVGDTVGDSVGETGYVLVIDQTRGDASILYGGASGATFAVMLAAAKAENPGKTVLIKTHPEVVAGHRAGHFSADDLDENTRFLDAALSPWQVLAAASSVYAVSSLMGFEAIVAGHRPHLFGKPFYGGWGLSDDRQEFQRRLRTLSVEALFAGVMLLYPTWYDPYRDRLCRFEDVADTLEAQARARREDHLGYDAFGVRLWKRRHFRRFFGGRMRFAKLAAPRFTAPRALVWAGKETAALRRAAKAGGVALARLEDGFLRSRGLGADLVPPLSLVADDLGIYYDPSRPSRLEVLLGAAADLPLGALDRAARLHQALLVAAVSKYNVGGKAGDWPSDRWRILVPGQVEDDASVLLGAGEIRRNIDLLAQVRAANPKAFIIYKPHPDVEAGLRPGAIMRTQVMGLADAIAERMDAVAAIEAVDGVWTMTSLLGFEALLRAKPVTCLGRPFYAGWGLTEDLARPVARRSASLTITAMVHAVLIDYPRYFDPVTGLPCPVEIVVERLQTGTVFTGSRRLRALAKAQGILASCAPWWR